MKFVRVINHFALFNGKTLFSITICLFAVCNILQFVFFTFDFKPTQNLLLSNVWNLRISFLSLLVGCFFLLGAVASFEDVAWVDLMSVGLRVFIHRIADWASVHLLLPQTSLLLLRLHTIIFIIFFFLGGGSNGKRSAQHRFVQTHKCTTSIFNFYERTESSSTMDPSVLTFKKKNIHFGINKNYNAIWQMINARLWMDVCIGVANIRAYVCYKIKQKISIYKHAPD